MGMMHEITIPIEEHRTTTELIILYIYLRLKADADELYSSILFIIITDHISMS